MRGVSTKAILYDTPKQGFLKKVRQCSVSLDYYKEGNIQAKLDKLRSIKDIIAIV